MFFGNWSHRSSTEDNLWGSLNNSILKKDYIDATIITFYIVTVFVKYNKILSIVYRVFSWGTAIVAITGMLCMGITHFTLTSIRSLYTRPSTHEATCLYNNFVTKYTSSCTMQYVQIYLHCIRIQPEPDTKAIHAISIKQSNEALASVESILLLTYFVQLVHSNGPVFIRLHNRNDKDTIPQNLFISHCQTITLQ